MRELVLRLRIWWMNRGRSFLNAASMIALMAIGVVGIYLHVSRSRQPPEFVDASVPVWECDDVAPGGLVEASGLRDCVRSRRVLVSRLVPPDVSLRLPGSGKAKAVMPIRRGMVLTGEPFEPVPEEALVGLIPLPAQGDLAPIARSERITRTVSPPKEFVADILARQVYSPAAETPPEEIGIVNYPTADVAFRCVLFSSGGDICYAQPLGGFLYAPGDQVLVPLTLRDAATLLAAWRVDSPKAAEAPQREEDGSLIPGIR